jgi:hypothetical protein
MDQSTLLRQTIELLQPEDLTLTLFVPRAIMRAEAIGMRTAPKPRGDVMLSDADLLRNVRDLFQLTLDDVASSGISRRTWVTGTQRRLLIGHERSL